MKQSQYLLKTEKLTKYFKNKLIFKDVNLEINPGDRIALIGVNGCGKTTLTDILLDLKSKSGGKVFYQNNKQAILRDTQVIYQTGEYPRKLLVKDVIRFYENLFELKMDRKKIDNLMTILQINDLKNQKINKLSFGQRKKLEAVLLLIIPSRLLIIDELTAGVDINGRIELARLFNDVYTTEKNKAMIWITHDVEEIKLCNRIILMSKRYNGIRFNGTISEAKQKYQTIKNMINTYIQEEIPPRLKNK